MPVTTLGCSTLRVVDPNTSNELLNITATSNPTLIHLNNVDLGYPNVRSNSAPVSGGHGVTDTTQWFADRAITAEMTLPQGDLADAADDTLRAVMGLGRYYLYVQRPAWTAERRVLVRGSTYTCPPGVSRQAQAGWIAPAGLLEDADLSFATLNPQASAQGGFTVPMSVPLIISGGLVSGATLIDVLGTAAAPPIIDIYGPCSDPLFRCVDTGKQMVFTGLSIADGDFLHVDMEARTVTLNNDPSQSRYSRIDLANSQWFTLPTGNGVQVIFSPNTPSGNCQAVLSWRSRWL